MDLFYIIMYVSIIIDNSTLLYNNQITFFHPYNITVIHAMSSAEKLRKYDFGVTVLLVNVLKIFINGSLTITEWTLILYTP